MAEFTFLSLLLVYVAVEYIFKFTSKDKSLKEHVILVLGLNMLILICLLGYLAANKIHGAIIWCHVIIGLVLIAMLHGIFDSLAMWTVNNLKNNHTRWVTYLVNQGIQWGILWGFSMYIPFFASDSELHANTNVNLAWNIMLVVVGGIITSQGVKVLIKEIMNTDEKEGKPEVENIQESEAGKTEAPEGVTTEEPETENNLGLNIILVAVCDIITIQGFKKLIKKIMNTDGKEGEPEVGNTQESEVKKVEEPKKGLMTGTTIGIVERLLILLGTLIGQLTPTLAGIIAIKSIGRFQQINDSSDYAEYYMVGSLLSIGFGIAVAQIIKMNLNYFA